ncbi:hypothetical protein MLD38_010990 [Melastoma candidum]|uniref:Uncharacterized protein n=1 Tax=Melastoma candidum TaxID=119954 RepID=A0ACB9R2R8_9MYRT|nr:hypothetical protein MLD38_010990 [Melastoma candidum]
MTLLSVELCVWNNDFAIPYPTFYHPSMDVEVSEWPERMRKQRRMHLFTFLGGPRPETQLTIRGEIIRQCVASRGNCNWVNCSSDSDNCNNPANVMKVFQRSVFCLQPGAAYLQYLWHLPKNYSCYSVFIPMDNTMKVNIGSVLVQIPEHDILAMREEVIRLIPGIVYADPRSSERTFKDAFDVTVKRVLEQVGHTREVVAAGGDPSIGFVEQNHHKFVLP